ncbi:MAG TPA: DNA mismatch repair endonuclease MutL, partial [bacterium]|nr:DNA mismatch repair endonuclease MutL [bacterium]
TIFIENAGKKKIGIIDNGCGLDEEDIFLCIERHATSKIKEAQDLYKITTHGFRGEALASIAAVSKMTIRSKPENANEGIELIIKSGIVKNKNIVGMQTGTEIIVEDLFFNTPVRKKFLKTEATETAHFLNVITNHSLAYPHINFKFYNENKLIFESPKVTSRLEALLNLYGYSIKDDLIVVNKKIEDVNIEAYFGNPKLSRKSRDRQKIFVNNRFIRNTMINAAVYNSYKTLLGVNEHPMYIVFIDLPAEQIDVNIHPTKIEVRFVDNIKIKNILENVFTDALQTSEKINPNIKLKTYSVAELKKEQLSNIALELEQSSVKKIQNYSLELEQKSDEAQQKTENIELAITEKSAENLELNYRIIGQINNLYIIVECDDGIKIIDQHAAHERILYNKFMKIIKSKEKIEAQMLLLPLTIELTQSEKILINQWLDVFEKMGMILEDFGGNTLILRSVPLFIGSRADDKRLLLDLIDDILALGKIHTIDEKLHNIVALMSCKSAIKSGSRLLVSEMQEIVEHILQDKDIKTCPHGRPTFINLSFAELEKTFKRT